MNIASGQTSANEAYQLLKDAGYPRNFVEKLLPDWWDNSLLRSGAGILQFAIFARQRLGIEFRFDDEGKLGIAQDRLSVRFKHRQGTETEELSICTYLGKAAADLASHTVGRYIPLPESPSDLRNYIISAKGGVISFSVLLDVCWDHGIPVLFLETLPRQAKRMTGMVVRQKSRPTILLGSRNQQHARQLFILAHELAHLQLGHVGDEAVLIDEDLDAAFDTLGGSKLGASGDVEERAADNYALDLIRGKASISFASSEMFQEPSSLVVFAVKRGRELGIDPGHIILSYAFAHNEWAFASKALNFIQGSSGALEVIKNKFQHYANQENLGKESETHLRMIQGYGR